MKARSEIKPGDYRASLSSKWDEDGGLQFMSETRYVFRQCPLLQIQVKFDVVKDGEGSPVGSPGDTVRVVSRVYVEYGAKD